MSNPYSAGPIDRATALERLDGHNFDLLVIGGGITGAGVALDAASRGLEVALIEKNDFASGTSSKSSKLIHGGLRYLEHREFRLMYQALSERDLLTKIAPHLVTPVPFFWPKWAGASPKAGVGLWIYDVMAGIRNVRRHDRINEKRAKQVAPSSRKSSGGYVYYDSQTDDTRLTLAVLQAARKAGAVICNHLEAVDLLEINETAVGCEASDILSGASIKIRAGDLVNATGVWADDIRMAEDPRAARYLRPSKGVHLVLDRAALPIEAAVIFPSTDRSLIFAVPWRSSVIVGTTDDEYEGSLDFPTVTPAERQYLLDSLSRCFDREFAEADVVGAFAGLRPLLQDPQFDTTRDLSRRHSISRGPKGVITVTGGKLTTYRLMAEQVVDLVTRRQGRYLRCVTASLRLGVTDLGSTIATTQGAADRLDLSPAVAESLVRSYGDDAPDVLRLAEELELIAPVVADLPYLKAELVWGIRKEMAMTAEDSLARRMRLSLEDSAMGLKDRQWVEDVMTQETGQTRDVVKTGINTYERHVLTERSGSLPEPVSVSGARSSAGRRSR